MTPSRAQTLAFPALLTGSAALAVGPLFVRLADVSPVSSAFWRMALATPILFLIARMARQDRPKGGNLVLLAAGGIMFAADLALWHLGIAKTTLANATLFGNSATFFLAAYGFMVARAWPSPRFAIALLLAGIGVALLIGRSMDLNRHYLAGDLLSIAAGFFYFLYFILVERARRATGSWAALGLVTLAGSATLLPAAWAMPGAFVPQHWGPLLLLAFGSQIIGQGLVVYAVGLLPPQVSGLGLLIQPVIAAGIGWARFGEQPGPADLAGAVLVLAALALTRLGRTEPPGPNPTPDG